MSLVEIIETRDAVISVESPVSAGISFCSWYSWCNTLHHGWLKTAFQLCWISMIVILSGFLSCLWLYEIPCNFLVLSDLNGFMTWGDFLYRKALLLLKDFIQACLLAVVCPLHPWHAHRNLKLIHRNQKYPSCLAVTVVSLWGWGFLLFTGPNMNL